MVDLFTPIAQNLYNGALINTMPSDIQIEEKRHFVKLFTDGLGTGIRIRVVIDYGEQSLVIRTTYEARRKGRTIYLVQEFDDMYDIIKKQIEYFIKYSEIVLSGAVKLNKN